MAAKGTESKTKIFNKMIEVYPNSFFEDEGKILRIPMEENGDIVEIKVTLTAAKTNLGGAAVASAFPAPSSEEVAGYMTPPSVSAEEIEVTEEEKERISQLLASLGL